MIDFTVKGAAEVSELQNLYKLQQIELELESLQKSIKELPVFASLKLQAETADAKQPGRGPD